jgi:hypothetical protein
MKSQEHNGLRKTDSHVLRLLTLHVFDTSTILTREMLIVGVPTAEPRDSVVTVSLVYRTDSCVAKTTIRIQYSEGTATHSFATEERVDYYKTVSNQVNLPYRH